MTENEYEKSGKPWEILRECYTSLAQGWKVLLKGWNTAGTTSVPVEVDADGHLQVDVLEGGGGGGTQYTENTDTVAGGEGTLALAENGAGVGVSLKLNAAEDLKVSLDGEEVSADVTKLGGNAIATGLGVTDSGTARITVASDSASLTVDDGGGSLSVDGTVAVSAISSELPAGTQNIGDVDIVKVGSIVDTNNSSSAQLDPSDAFTGTATDLTGYSTVTYTVHSDVDSADDGISAQFSIDGGINWDDEYNFTLDVSRSGTRRFQLPVCAQHFRLVYTNGSATTAAFRAQTILHTANQLTSVHNLGDDTNPDRSCTVVKAALMAVDPAGPSSDFVAIQANAAGVLKVGGSVDVDSIADPATLVDFPARTATSYTTWTGGGSGSHSEIFASSATHRAEVTIINTTDKNAIISWDNGTTDHQTITKDSARIFELHVMNRYFADSAITAKLTDPSRGNIIVDAAS
jgi:hypothetical protein